MNRQKLKEKYSSSENVNALFFCIKQLTGYVKISIKPKKFVKFRLARQIADGIVLEKKTLKKFVVFINFKEIRDKKT